MIFRKIEKNNNLYIFILKIFLGCYICIAVIVTLLPILPRVLGFVLHINATHPRVMQQLIPKYLIDQKRYIYLTLMYMGAAILIGGTALVGIGMMLLSYFEHACGMFRVAR